MALHISEGCFDPSWSVEVRRTWAEGTPRAVLSALQRDVRPVVARALNAGFSYDGQRWSFSRGMLPGSRGEVAEVLLLASELAPLPIRAPTDEGLERQLVEASHPKIVAALL